MTTVPTGRPASVKASYRPSPHVMRDIPIGMWIGDDSGWRFSRTASQSLPSAVQPWSAYLVSLGCCAADWRRDSTAAGLTIETSQCPHNRYLFQDPDYTVIDAEGIVVDPLRVRCCFKASAVEQAVGELAQDLDEKVVSTMPNGQIDSRVSQPSVPSCDSSITKEGVGFEKGLSTDRGGTRASPRSLVHSAKSPPVSPLDPRGSDTTDSILRTWLLARLRSAVWKPEPTSQPGTPPSNFP